MYVYMYTHILSLRYYYAMVTTCTYSVASSVAAGQESSREEDESASQTIESLSRTDIIISVLL